MLEELQYLVCENLMVTHLRIYNIFLTLFPKLFQALKLYTSVKACIAYTNLKRVQEYLYNFGQILPAKSIPLGITVLNPLGRLDPLSVDSTAEVKDSVNQAQCCTTVLEYHFHLIKICTVLSSLLLCLG